MEGRVYLELNGIEVWADVNISNAELDLPFDQFNERIIKPATLAMLTRYREIRSYPRQRPARPKA